MHKSLLLLTLLSLSLCVSCSKEKEGVVGSGKTIVETREVFGFDRIFFSGSGNLYITQGGEESLKIEAEDNIVSLLTTEVTDGNLYISFKEMPNIRSTKPVNLYAKVKKLQEIHLSGSGTISSQHLDVQTLKVNVSGSGNTDLTLFGNKLIAILSGSGKFIMKGAVNIQDIWISGSGIYEANLLQSKISNINVSGAGRVLVNVQDDMNVRISGAGSVYYIGNPKITQSIAGSGKIQQLKDSSLN